MSVRIFKAMQILLFLSSLLLAVTIGIPNTHDGVAWHFAPAPAKAAQGITEKEAFEGAKELGTIAAWEAFLKSFPKGFRADLARAYIRKLGGKPAAPKRAARKPPVTQAPPETSRTARLPLHSTPRGRSPWRVTRYEMDEGRSSVTAASVKASGLEFLIYCNAHKRLSVILRESERGRYPEFNARIAQGLEVPGGGTISMRFSKGARFSRSATIYGLTGEVGIAYREEGGGLQPDGRLIRRMLRSNSFMLSAPPFQANFQLRKSRGAICAVANQCGARISGCGRYGGRPTAGKNSPSLAAQACELLGMAYRSGKCVPKSAATQ